MPFLENPLQNLIQVTNLIKIGAEINNAGGWNRHKKEAKNVDKSQNVNQINLRLIEDDGASSYLSLVIEEHLFFLFIQWHPMLLILCNSAQLKGLVVIATQWEKSQKHPKSSNQWNTENQGTVLMNYQIKISIITTNFPFLLCLIPQTTSVFRSTWLLWKNVDTWIMAK